MSEKRPPLSAFLQKQKEEITDDAIIAKLKGVKGEKGETGPEGPRGPQGFRGTPGEDGENGKDGLNGKDGKQGPKGDTGEQGVKGDDGITPSIDELEAIVLSLIPDADIPELTPKDIIEKINKAKTVKIKRERVEGFDEIEGLAKSANRNVQNILSLGGSRQTAIKVSGVLLGTGINTINFVGATGTVVGDGSEANVTTSGGSNLSLTTTGTSGAATYNSGTGVLNIPVYSSGSGGISRSINTVSTTTAAGSTASTDYVYLCSGTFTITLPATTGNTNLYTIKNIGAGTITVVTTGGETIDGSATASIPVQWTSIDLVAASGNWNVV